jgi:hypothetical protein
MRNYLILILLIICSLTISSCGGGDGVTQPSSISTPISNDLSAPGYIIIKVEWPQNQKINKEQKSIISSMIPGTEILYIDVLDIYGNSFTTPLTATIPKSKKEAKIDFIPATKVIVRASAYDISSVDRPSSDHLLSTSEKKIDIEVGYNKIDLDLGHYDFSLKSDPNTIYPDIDPGAESARQATITARVKLEYPPDPNDPILICIENYTTT